MLNIKLPTFLESVKNNETIIKIFSFYYVYDLTQNITVSIISLLIVEISRMYQNEIIDFINKNKDNIMEKTQNL